MSDAKRRLVKVKQEPTGSALVPVAAGHYSPRPFTGRVGTIERESVNKITGSVDFYVVRFTDGAIVSFYPYEIEFLENV